MIKNKTLIQKKDIERIVYKPFIFISIMALVIIIQGLICLYLDPVEQSLYFVLIGVGTFLALLVPTTLFILKKQLNANQYPMVYDYQFNDDEIVIDALVNGVENNIKVKYDLLKKYKFKNGIHFLHLSKVIYYMVKDESFASNEDRELFLNKVKIVK